MLHSLSDLDWSRCSNTQKQKRKDGKLHDSGKKEEGERFHKLHALGMNDDFCDRVGGFGSERSGRLECLASMIW